jgi:cell wall-associated NlpC family hydrolase
MEPLNQLTAGEFIVGIAKSQTGVPYVFGGEEEGVGFDCSGLTQWACNYAGVEIPRTTFEQYKLFQLAKHVPNKPGDLIFIQGSDGAATEPGHVMIYLSPGFVIQAPFTGEDVGRYPVDTSSYMFRTRPALAHPQPTTVTKNGLVVLPNVAAEDLARRNGWALRYWNGHAFLTTPPQPLRTTFVYASAQYKKRR